VSFRQTYYDLYNSENLNIFGNRNNRNQQDRKIDINVEPDYMFRDMNVKYSTKIGDKDFFYVSLLRGIDNFSYDLNQQSNNRLIIKNTAEKNIQSGGAVFYEKKWKNGNTSDISISYSGLSTHYSDNYSVKNIKNNIINYEKDLITNNKLDEVNGRLDNRITINESNLLEAGIGFVYNQLELDENIFNTTGINIFKQTQRVNMFLQDNISFGKKLNLKLGFRLDYPVALNEMYFQPRISGSYSINEYWKLNSAWGIYNQFITKTSTVDNLGNYRYLWTVADNKKFPVLTSEHLIAGTSYHNNGLTLSAEGYYKKSSGLTRYYNSYGYGLEDIFQGLSRSYGLDFLIKKDLNGHSGWIAYTLSKTEEFFSYFYYNRYRRAYHDQRHELKFAGLINMDPFYFSSNYVYGSGFPVPPSSSITTKDTRYNRFDISIIYKFAEKRYQGEVGLSILNLFNTENIKLDNFERVQGIGSSPINIHAEAIPFTPALYLKLAF